MGTIVATEQTTTEHAAALTALGCPALEARLPSATHPDGVYLHGGGPARLVYKAAVARGLDCGCLIRFVNNGDTRAESSELGWCFDPLISSWQCTIAAKLCSEIALDHFLILLIYLPTDVARFLRFLLLFLTFPCQFF